MSSETSRKVEATRSPRQQQLFRVFEEAFERYQELHRFAAIDNAVVIGQRHIHHWADNDFVVARIVDYDRTLFDLVHPQDADLGRVEDRCTEQRAKDTAIGDGEGSTAQIFQ